MHEPLYSPKLSEADWLNTHPKKRERRKPKNGTRVVRQDKGQESAAEMGNPESYRPWPMDSEGNTNQGKKRPYNEDRVLVIESDEALQKRGIDGVYVVADGMGGLEAGDQAAQAAVEEVKSQVRCMVFPGQRLDFGEFNQREVEDWIRGMVAAADGAVEKVTLSGGTTLTMAVRWGDQLAIANVGDSRTYLISPTGINQVTEDHSFVQLLVNAGEITKKQARTHPRRNVITRSLGQGNSEPDVFFTKIPEGGSLLLCSDGLSGPVDDQAIESIVRSSRSAEQAVSRLIKQANANGGPDNIGVVVVRYQDRPEPPEARTQLLPTEQAGLLPELPNFGDAKAVKEFIHQRAKLMVKLKRKLDAGTLTDQERTLALACMTHLEHLFSSAPEGYSFPLAPDKVLQQLQRDAMALLPN